MPSSLWTFFLSLSITLALASSFSLTHTYPHTNTQKHTNYAATPIHVKNGNHLPDANRRGGLGKIRQQSAIQSRDTPLLQNRLEFLYHSPGLGGNLFYEKIWFSTSRVGAELHTPVGGCERAVEDSLPAAHKHLKLSHKQVARAPRGDGCCYVYCTPGRTARVRTARSLTGYGGGYSGVKTQTSLSVSYTARSIPE